MTYWVYILASKPGGTVYVGEWKIDLIIKDNPDRRDVYDEIVR